MQLSPGVDLGDSTNKSQRTWRPTDFGRGSGHRAGLNFGDCLAYALALDTREPLLWKGDDFGHTEIAAALDR